MRTHGAGLSFSLAAALASVAFAAQPPSPLDGAQPEAGRLVLSGSAALAGRRDAPDADSYSKSKEPLGNFHQIDPGFYRSAQPYGDGFARLKKLGVKTILDLKEDPSAERRDARAVGIKVESVPMIGIVTPTFEQVDRALDVIASAEKPLLVHCEHGQDRTGFVVAAYRVTVQHASIESAVKEAKSYGCCFVLYEDLGKYLKRYSRHRRAPALAGAQPGT